MTRAPPENISVPEAGRGPGTGGHQYPSQSTPVQSPQGASNFVDGSGPIFSMYMKMASEEDKKMAENWKEDADGILIFTGLFSAAVASLISVSIQDIRPNSQDASNFYLANIYQAVADPNRIHIPSSLPSSPPTFSPPKSAVWVNALWFLSLVISLTCALLATLLQQWARRYLKVTQLRCSLHKQARIRAFFAEGVDKFLLPWAVEALPTLLHVSLFLFLAGLAVFLSTVNLTIFKLVLTWACGCTVFYGCITIMPIFRHDSPYHTPLLLAAWHIVTGMGFVAFRALRRLACDRSAAYHRFDRWQESCLKLVTQGMQGTTEETALNSSSEINTRVFMWTFDSLDEDHELERFFSGLPGFCSSEVVDDPLPRLTWVERYRLSTALMGLFDRTFSSHLLSDRDKQRRAIICAKAIDPAYPLNAATIIDRILSDHQLSILFPEIVRTVRCWREGRHRDLAAFAEVTLSRILAIAPQRDDSWFILASDELGVPESVLRDYAKEGDSLSLAILIHIARRQLTHNRISSTSLVTIRFSKVLNEASKFNVQNTLPELQHEFCALWDQIVLEAQNENDWTFTRPLLAPIRNLYLALHQGTNAASTKVLETADDDDWILSVPTSYPLCDIPGHRPDSTPHIHDVSSSTTLACATPPHKNATLPPTSPVSPDAPSSSEPAPLHVDENLRVPVTSDMTVPHPTPETSSSPPPLPSTPGPAAVPPQHNPDPQTPSGAPNIPSSASTNPVPNNILPTGPPLSSNSPMTRFDLSPSRPEPHRSIMITTAPSAPPGPTSALDLGTAAEGDSSSMPGLRKEKDIADPPSLNRVIPANTRATLNLPPQSLSLPLVSDPDATTAGLSPREREPYAKHTGDHPRHPSLCSYDMV